MKTCGLKNLKEYLFAAFEEMRDEIEKIKSANELKILLLKKSCFTNYNVLEQLACHFRLAGVQKKLSDFEAFRGEKYGKILAENFAVVAVDEYMKDRETPVCYECAFMYVL